MKVGDNVVCIKTMASTQGDGQIIKGQIYPILDEWACGCGWRHFDIGHTTLYVSGCPTCHSHSQKQGMLWARSEYFAPIQYNSAHSELLQKAVTIEKSDIPIKEPKKETI